MSTIAIAAFFLIRVFVPVSVLLLLGEWIRRREANYWSNK
jgi:hypothetical protein